VLRVLYEHHYRVDLILRVAFIEVLHGSSDALYLSSLPRSKEKNKTHGIHPFTYPSMPPLVYGIL